MSSKSTTLEQPVNAGTDVSATTTADDLSQVVSFTLADELYGLNIMCVQEIILQGKITEVPEVPDYIRGLINLRGKVIPIVDLRARFGLGAAEPTEHTRTIVVDTEATTFGIVVDTVNEVMRIEASQIEPPPSELVGLDQQYLRGLVKMEERIMILLNIEKILSHEDQASLVTAATA